MGAHAGKVAGQGQQNDAKAVHASSAVEHGKEAYAGCDSCDAQSGDAGHG